MEKINLSKAYHRFFIAFPAVLLFVLILLIGATYYVAYLIPQTFKGYLPYTTPDPEHSSPTTGMKVFFAVFSAITILLLISFFRTVFTDPGYFPDPLHFEHKLILSSLQKNNSNHFTLNGPDEESGLAENTTDPKFISNIGNVLQEGPVSLAEQHQIRDKLVNYLNERGQEDYSELDCNDSYYEKGHFSMMEQLEANSDPEIEVGALKHVNMAYMTLCNSCYRWKVERSHHCRQCQKCVLRMDHHCYWLASCIGFGNYKYFCLLHIYALIETIIVAATFWRPIQLVAFGKEARVVETGLFLFVYLCNLALLSFVGWLFYSNLFLVLNGETLIEQSDRRRFPTQKPHNQYDLGLTKNLKNVFGENPWLWFVPTTPVIKGKGVVFEYNRSNSNNQT